MKLCVACRQKLDDAGWRCTICGHAPAGGDAPAYEQIPVLAPELVDLDKGFNQETVSRLARIEGDSFWFRARNQLIQWALQTYHPDAESLLEVGCGTGFVLAGLRRNEIGLRLCGADSSLAALAVARGRVPDAELLQLDATHLPFADEFDAVGCFDVLEHLDEDERVLTEIGRSLHPGGGLLLTVPQHQWLWSLSDEVAHHRRRYSRRELVAKVTAAGFQIQRVSSFVSVPLPAMAISRRVLRRPADDDCISELNPGRALNLALERALNIERALIRRGISFPAGGSLLLVAQRGR